jgi:hypothetical protein
MSPDEISESVGEASSAFDDLARLKRPDKVLHALRKPIG